MFTIFRLWFLKIKMNISQSLRVSPTRNRVSENWWATRCVWVPKSGRGMANPKSCKGGPPTSMDKGGGMILWMQHTQLYTWNTNTSSLLPYRNSHFFCFLKHILENVLASLFDFCQRHGYRKSFLYHEVSRAKSSVGRDEKGHALPPSTTNEAHWRFLFVQTQDKSSTAEWELQPCSVCSSLSWT